MSPRPPSGLDIVIDKEADDMAEHTVGTRDEWLVARKRLLERERESLRLEEELTRQRRELPWVPLQKEYRFETEEGTRTLAELFDGRSQLLVYHLMFGPDWTAACPGCSSLADHFDGQLPHLHANDATLVCVSHAPIEKVAAYRRRMGWTFPYVSAFGSDFNVDFGVSFTAEQREAGPEYNFERVDVGAIMEEFSKSESMAEIAAGIGTDVEGYVTTEGPGLSAFALEDGVVHHTYSAYAPESNFLVGYAQLLERAPLGGRADVRVRAHDEYAASGSRP